MTAIFNPESSNIRKEYIQNNILLSHPSPAASLTAQISVLSPKQVHDRVGTYGQKGPYRLLSLDHILMSASRSDTRRPKNPCHRPFSGPSSTSTEFSRCICRPFRKLFRCLCRPSSERENEAKYLMGLSEPSAGRDSGRSDGHLSGKSSMIDAI